MVAATCPTRETLLQYSNGTLSEEQSDDLASHLQSCPDCQVTIMTLEDAGDTLIGRLRAPLGSDSFLAEPEFQAAVGQAIATPGARPALEEAGGGDAQSAPSMPQMLGEYQVLEELGHGGMGRVYKALHTKLDRVVALKVLSGGRVGDRQAIARFGREMRAIGQLDHPNLVRAYDAREIAGTPVLIMEFVDGLDLAEIARRLGPLPVAEACELVRQTALGLQRAHEHGLVHRDIKPSNIMLTVGQASRLPVPNQEQQQHPPVPGRTDGQAGSLPHDALPANVKILDLGLARFYTEGATGVSPVASGEEMTGTGQAMGTADYMAPEQAADSRTADIRADIYSLGCTLYKLLTGRAPFSGPQYRSALEKMNAHVSQPVPPVRQFAPEVPEQLAAILDRMLAKTSADRFATPTEVAEALEPFCSGANLGVLAARAAASPRSCGESISGREEQAEVPALASAPVRRRSAIKTILVGLAFFAAMAAAFAAGVIITIKRNGQTYQLEVPENSRTVVDQNGNATVETPGRMAETPARMAPPALRFGPVIERVVRARAENKGSDAIDLAAGKLVDLPKEFGTWSAEQQNQWSTEHHVDLVIDFAGPFGMPGGMSSSMPGMGSMPASSGMGMPPMGSMPGMGTMDRGELLPQGLKLAAIANDRWENATREDIQSALASAMPESYISADGKYRVGVAEVRERRGITSYVLIQGPPSTFAFQTRKGDVGLLQVLRYTEAPRGIRIRYKLVEPSAGAGGVTRPVRSDGGDESHERPATPFAKPQGVPRAPEPPLRFGPVIEQVVNALGQGKGGEGVDLAGGKLVDVPKEFGQWPAQQQREWSAEHNVDLVVDQAAGVGVLGMVVGPGALDSNALVLVPEGLKLAAVWDGRWESPTAEELRSALASVAPEQAMSPVSGMEVRVAVVERHGIIYWVPFGGPLTLAFQTRKGDLGLLQIVRYTEEPRGMRIRYKLAQPAAAVPGTGLQQPPSSTGNEQAERPRLVVYQVVGISPNLALEVLRMLFAGAPDVRLTLDAKTKKLIVLAQPSQHAAIRAALDRLERSVRAAPGKPAGKIRFNFHDQPWKDVFQWLAKAADLSLVMKDSPPSGTLSKTDDREYTPEEAIDLVNFVIEPTGYTLLRRDRQLVVINLMDPNARRLIPTVEPDALDAKDAHEFVDVSFHLRKADAKVAEKAEQTVRPLLGPHGQVILVPNSWDLRVIDMARHVRQIRDVLNRIEGGVVRPERSDGRGETGEHPTTPFAKPQGTPPGPKASTARRVPFTIGPHAFTKGDEIKIAEVRSELGTLEKGDTVTLTGTYTLASHPAATLWFYITEDARKVVPGEPDGGVGQQGDCTISHFPKRTFSR